jgi:hypothetical protein
MEHHEHHCEIKMLKQKYWRKFCPNGGEIGWDEKECDHCNHMVVVYFENQDGLKISKIVR